MVVLLLLKPSIKFPKHCLQPKSENFWCVSVVHFPDNSILSDRKHYVSKVCFKVPLSSLGNLQKREYLKTVMSHVHITFQYKVISRTTSLECITMQTSIFSHCTFLFSVIYFLPCIIKPLLKSEQKIWTVV